MKVMYISNDVGDGGAVFSLLDMLKIVKNEDVKPIVIIPKGSILKQKLEKINILCFEVNFSNGYGKIGKSASQKADKNFVDNFKAACKIGKIARQENVEIIHSNSSVSNVGAMAAILLGLPHVWHFRELLEEQFFCEYWDKELKCKLAKNTDCNISISNTVRTVIEKRYGIKSCTIYNGVDSVKYFNKIEISEWKKRRNRFIITGRIEEGKGQWDAVKAVEILVNEGINDIRLLLVGDTFSKYSWCLKRYIKEKKLENYISVFPFISDIRELRKSCKYVLVTSRFEALGRCTIEAMLAGNLIIGANQAGTKEIIKENQKYGFLYEACNVNSLADIMRLVLNTDENKLISIMEMAQKYALGMFNLQRYGVSMINSYKKVLANYEPKYDMKQELLKKIKTIDISDLDRNDKSVYFMVCRRWDFLLDSNRNIFDYFNEKGIKNIAIYGMGKLGCRLYDELDTTFSDVKIAYVVDQDICCLSEVIKVFKPDDELPTVDMLVVTVSGEERKLVNYYQERCNFSVIGISEILMELAKN